MSIVMHAEVMGESVVLGWEEKAVLKVSHYAQSNEFHHRDSIDSDRPFASIFLCLGVCARMCEYVSGVSLQFKIFIGNKGAIAQFSAHQKVPFRDCWH